MARSSEKEKISVVGLGFVGLSLVAVNAKNGFHTIGVDIDSNKISRLRARKSTFFEPNIDNLLNKQKNANVHFTTDFNYAVRNSEITFLTVGTPLMDGSNDVDLSYVMNAAKQIARAVKSKRKFHLLAIKSTVPPLTTEKFILPIFKDHIEDKKMAVVTNPEFLSEGFAVSDLLNPHLIVIGSNSRQGSLILERYYRNFHKTPPEIMHTNIATAELIKYANNAFLATKISFINSIGALCQEIPGSDVNVVAKAIGKDPGIGPLFLQAGPGFGGSCLPKDLVGLIKFSQKLGKRSDLFRTVKEVNDSQIRCIIEMIDEQSILAEGYTIAILGLAFKNNTDDIREAASIRIVENLLKYKIKVKVHDPVAQKNFRQIFGAKISYSASTYECLEGADCCVILTEWDEYKSLKPIDFLRLMRTNNVIDARRVLVPNNFRDLNFKAIGFGS